MTITTHVKPSRGPECTQLVGPYGLGQPREGPTLEILSSCAIQKDGMKSW